MYLAEFMSVEKQTDYLYYKAHSIVLCVFARLRPGHIYGPIFKPRVPMDFPWPRDDYKNKNFQILKN